MSYSMNKAIIIGRVGQSPKIKLGSTGKRTAIFSVATNEKWKSPDGQQQQKTEWHNIFVLAESAATFVANYIGKGDLVCVDGQLQTKEYNDRDGNLRRQTSIVVKQFGGSVGLLNASKSDGNNDNYDEDDDDEYEDLGEAIPF